MNAVLRCITSYCTKFPRSIPTVLFFIETSIRALKNEREREEGGRPSRNVRDKRTVCKYREHHPEGPSGAKATGRRPSPAKSDLFPYADSTAWLSDWTLSCPYLE